jgi:hypothetical protein
VNGAALAKGGIAKVDTCTSSDGATNCSLELKTPMAPMLLSMTIMRTVQGTGGKALPNSDDTSITEPWTLVTVWVTLGCLTTRPEMLQSLGAGGILRKKISNVCARALEHIPECSEVGEEDGWVGFEFSNGGGALTK